MQETSSFAESNPVVSGSFNREIVLSGRRWTDTLFSFTTTRPPGFDFTNGKFALISADLDRFAPPQALGIASRDRDDVLEFLCGSEQPQAVGL
jgi:ferredoxin-NADP reductase